MRIAIVTGGSRGLGRALCEQLSTRGYKLIEFSRTAPHPYSVSTDLSDPDLSRKKVRHALLSLKRDACDGLLVIHNAGTLTPIGPAASKSDAAVLANINTNFVSALLVLSEVMATFQSIVQRQADGELVAPDRVAQAVLRLVAEPTLVPGERYAASAYFSAP